MHVTSIIKDLRGGTAVRLFVSVPILIAVALTSYAKPPATDMIFNLWVPICCLVAAFLLMLVDFVKHPEHWGL